MDWTSPAILGSIAGIGLLIAVLYGFEVLRYSVAEPVRSLLQRAFGWTIRMAGLVCLLGAVVAAVAVIARQVMHWIDDGVWMPQSALQLLLEFTVSGPWYPAVAEWEVVHRGLSTVNGAVLLLGLGLIVAFIATIASNSLVFRGERVWRRAADARRLRQVARKTSIKLDPIDYPA